MPVVAPLLHATKYRGLARFLGGRVLYTDPINTLIVFMGIYATKEVGFTTTETQWLLLVSILFAVVGGFAWGVLVDKIGPKRTLNIVLLIWMFALSAIVSIAVFDLSKWFFWAVATLAGVALGGVWAADRPYMLRLAPPRFVGEFYGLYAMVGRFASIIGPFMWGYITNTLGLGRPVAVLSLLVFVVIAFVVLQGSTTGRASGRLSCSKKHRFPVTAHPSFLRRGDVISQIRVWRLMQAYQMDSCFRRNDGCTVPISRRVLNSMAAFGSPKPGSGSPLLVH